MSLMSTAAGSSAAPAFIDMLGHASISFSHFVFRGPGRFLPASARGFLARSSLLWLACGAVAVAGCTRRGGIQPVEDTETTGRISIAASVDAQPLLAQELAS